MTYPPTLVSLNRVKNLPNQTSRSFGLRPPGRQNIRPSHFSLSEQSEESPESNQDILRPLARLNQNIQHENGNFPLATNTHLYLLNFTGFVA